MKVLSVAINFIVFIAAIGATELRDGRPGCKTDVEMETVYYRNLWDPTAYWKCEAENTEATLVRCSDGAFQDKIKKCVSWDDWEWEDPVAPPSLAR